MRLTKYEHACFTVEKNGKLLVVDPGVYTTDLPALDNVVAVVITHEHPDHYDVAALGAINARSPEATIYADKTITRQLGDTLPHQAVIAGQTVTSGPFNIEFYGGDHATIHADISTPVNLGVMINDVVYYPGDSFTLPDKPVEILLLPTAAPWMKMSEAFEFLMGIEPNIAIPTHDAIASTAGKNLADTIISSFAAKVGATYTRLTEPLEIDG